MSRRRCSSTSRRATRASRSLRAGLSACVAVAGCSAPTDTVETPEICLARITDSSGRESSARALELTRAAPPARRVRVSIGLDEPPFDFGAYRNDPGGLQEARTRQLAPLQAPTLAWLRDHGATQVHPFWLTNWIFATLGAGEVPGALCAPGVRVVDVDEHWYTVVEPPWDTRGLGPGECPIVDGRCPAHCSEVYGVAHDGPLRCGAGGALVACSRVERVETNWTPVCRVQESSGHRYVFSVQAPWPPAFLGWRACTEAESPGYAPPTTSGCP